MLIAQISDTHMLPPGEIAYGLCDTAAALATAVRTVNAARPDFVVHTGDIAHHGAPEAYALTLDILAGLDAPYCAIPGNHDDRANMRRAFAGASWLPAGGPEDFIHYDVDIGPLRLVALDTMIPGEAGGALCDDRLAWLEGRLDAAGDRPTIVALHHPPFPPGLDGFSAAGLENADRLAALLRDRPQVVRLIAGHNHRSITGMCGSVPTVVAPSACYPFAFDTAPGAPLSISAEAPGVAMHLWRPEHGLISHCVQTGDLPPPVPLLKDGKRLLPASTRKGA